MNMNLDILLNALFAYFIIMDPLGVSLVFNALTANQQVERMCCRMPLTWVNRDNAIIYSEVPSLISFNTAGI